MPLGELEFSVLLLPGMLLWMLLLLDSVEWVAAAWGVAECVVAACGTFGVLVALS